MLIICNNITSFFVATLFKTSVTRKFLQKRFADYIYLTYRCVVTSQVKMAQGLKGLLAS